MPLKLGIRCCIQHEIICLPAVFNMIDNFIFSHVYERAKQQARKHWFSSLLISPLKLVRIQPSASLAPAAYSNQIIISDLKSMILVGNQQNLNSHIQTFLFLQICVHIPLLLKALVLPLMGLTYFGAIDKCK